MFMIMDDKSHKFAGELLEWIKSILRDLGIETGRVDEMEGIIYTVLIALFAWAVAWILRYVLHYVFLKILGKSKNEILRVLVDRRVFSGVAHVLPPLIMLSLLPLVYDDYRSLIGWVERFCWIFKFGCYEGSTFKRAHTVGKRYFDRLRGYYCHFYFGATFPDEVDYRIGSFCRSIDARF